MRTLAAPTRTSTPVPTISPEKVGGLVGIPSLQLDAESNQVADSAVQQYARTMGIKAETVKLSVQVVKDYSGHPFVFANTLDRVPLLIARKMDTGRYSWSLVAMKDLSNLLGFPVGGMIEKYRGTEILYAREFNAGLIPSLWGLGIAKNGIAGDFDFDTYEDFQYRFEQQVAGYDAKHLLLNHIIWNAYSPKGFDTLNREQAIAWMKNYIKTVMEHYRGKIDNYVVVNEPHPIFGSVADDPLRKIMGPDYIDIAFQTAREVNPNAFLIFNETDNHGPEGKYVWDTATIGNDLYARGLIDAVGVQGHLSYGDSYPAPTEDQMLQILSNYKAPIILTEVDANISGVKGSDRFVIQAEWYRSLISACLRTQRCKGIFFYGAFPDRNSWYVLGQHLTNADSTPWDNNFKPKAAYYAILQALYSAVPH